MVFDHGGGCAQLEHRQFFPEPGWVEHDPIEIWEKTGLPLATDRTWPPVADAQARHRGYHRWKRAVERSFGWFEEPTAT